MKSTVCKLFADEGLTDVAFLPFSACRVTLPRLLEKEGFAPQSVILFLVPYFGGYAENLSAYAATEDYHLFAKELGARLSPALSSLFPDFRFRLFSDHSPIDERHAAVRAGLGVFGKNGLLLTERYSSFQFIGEIITDVPAALWGETPLFPLRGCEGCGRCLSACPTGILRGEGEDCLSAITQKKGELSPDEKALMRKHHTAWGCDACQKCCPYTQRALASGSIYTPLPFFQKNRIHALSSALLSHMPEEEFRRRAFAWRGRKTVERNVALLEKEDE